MVARLSEVGAQQATGKGASPAAAGSSSTHFAFEHKVFAIEGAYFSLTADKSQAVYNVPLGGNFGGVGIKALCTTFGIAPDSPDNRLLRIVEDSLKFVREIRPGESIPRELLDGTASWSVEDVHRAAARNRLTLQLVSWFSGNEVVITERQQLQEAVEKPETQARAKEATKHLAERLGLPEGRRDEVVKKIDAFVHELSYLEALRDRFGLVQQILERLTQYRMLYRSDRTLSNELQQVNKLLRIPIGEFVSSFLQIDAQTGEVLSLLRGFDAQVAFMRRMRDDLHWKLMDWDELIKRWEAAPMDRSPASEALLKDTYRFLAQRFLQAHVWKRS